jgi:hypothetical protein
MATVVLTTTVSLRDRQPPVKGQVCRSTEQGTNGAMLTILLIVLLIVLLFGGGGYYYRGRRRL